MNSRFDQALDMALGAGLMYIFDPERGKDRRTEILDRAKSEIDNLVDQARAELDDIVGQAQAGLDQLGGAAKDARQRAADTATGVVPAAKAALFEKLAMDQMVMERAKARMAGRKMMPFKASSGSRFGPILAVLAAAALGAGLMFLFDPEMGRRRRALLRDQVTRTKRATEVTLEDTRFEAQNRAEDAAAEARLRMSDRPVSDHVLAERVRAHLNGVTSHPGSINVTARHGRVTLSGPILADEVEGLVERVRSIPGVEDVENRLEVHSQAGNVPGLQGHKR